MLCNRFIHIWFLAAILLFVFAYSLPTLTTKPAYWYDEAINVEMAGNFADFGNLDLIVAPNTFSGKGATVGSTGYPVTVPLAGFFKVFGFGLTQARVYMLLWIGAFIIFFFFIAKNLWGSSVASFGTLLIATFAPFYGNGRSVMGEIPGFVFFLCSFYLLERKKYWWSGLLIGFSVVAKPSVFIFFIPAYALVLLLGQDEWQKRIANLMRVGFASLTALVPWILLYGEELARGGLGENILAHFKNPYQEAGISISANIVNNLQTFFYSTTLLYFTVLLVLVIAAMYLHREVFRTHWSIFILSATYIPFAFLQYLKSFGYLRYLITVEFLVFILFVISLPVLVQWVFGNSPLIKGVRGLFKSSDLADSAVSFSSRGGSASGGRKEGIITGAILTFMVIVQTVHLFWFSDLYPSEKTQKTVSYLSSAYSDKIVGIMNVPQIGSLLSAEIKYQYFSTYGLWRFGANPLLLPPERLPDALVIDAGNDLFSEHERKTLERYYAVDSAFSLGFPVYKKK